MLAAQQRYAERLSHFCRIAPYNWFNFFDFWQKK
jgi:predicted LPLAT superfamily acyltransferase